MTDGYADTGGSGDYSVFGNLIGQAIGAWSANEVSKRETEQANAYATPYRFNNPQALAPAPDKTMTYVAVAGVVLAAGVALIFALKA